MQRAPPNTESCQETWPQKGKGERIYTRFLFVTPCHYSRGHIQRCFLLLVKSLEYAEVRIIRLEMD